MFLRKSRDGEQRWWAWTSCRNLPSFPLSQLLDSKTITMLAIWHTFGIWLATFMLIASASDQILSWNIHFYLSIYGDVSEAWKVTMFFVTFMKSWILIITYSQVVRFSFWIFRGAWHADCFDAYRRALTGEARCDLEKGVLCTHGWALNHSRCSQWLHMAVQLFIYFTLDILPLLSCVFAASSGETILNSAAAAFRTLALFSLVHVLLFFVSWNLTDVFVKITTFKDALSSHEGNTMSLEDGPPAGEGQPSPLEDEESNELSSKASGSQESSLFAQQPDSTEQNPHTQEAKKLNICYQVCSFWKGVASVRLALVWIVLMIAFLGAKNLSLFRATLCIGLIAVMYCCLDSFLQMKYGSRTLAISSSRLKALQQWSEIYCSMTFEAQFHLRLTVSIMLVQLTFVCGLAGFLGMMWAALGILAFNALRQAFVRLEKPYSWFFGPAEGLLLAVITAGLCHLQEVDAWTDFCIVLLLSFARQLGLNKEVKDGVRIERAVTIFLNAVTILVVLVIMFTVISGGEMKDFSVYCSKDHPNCKYYRIPYKPEVEAWPQCSLSFPLSNVSTTDLTLADFGLFSGLAYEYPSGVDKGLELNFPNWRTEFAHLPAVPKLGAGSNFSSDFKELDWTAFYQFTRDNSTSVFAIRGTFEPIDA